MAALDGWKEGEEVASRQRVAKMNQGTSTTPLWLTCVDDIQLGSNIVEAIDAFGQGQKWGCVAWAFSNEE
jgi:hypothetical protein